MFICPTTAYVIFDHSVKEAMCLHQHRQLPRSFLQQHTAIRKECGKEYVSELLCVHFKYCKSTSLQIVNAGEGMEKRNPPPTLMVGMWDVPVFSQFPVYGHLGYF